MTQERFHDALFMAIARRDLLGLQALIQSLDETEDAAWAEVIAGLLNNRLEPLSECWLVDALNRANHGWQLLSMAYRTPGELA